MCGPKKILIYGYGNPGRQDDGLGKALIDRAEVWLRQEDIGGITLDVNYQLQVEDVMLMKEKDLIVFVDASMDEKIETCHIGPVLPESQASFTMHSVSPGFILSMFQQMFGEPPPVYLMQIRGYEWEMSESLTPGALKNLDRAWEKIREIILCPADYINGFPEKSN